MLCAGCSMERLEEVLTDMGESIESEEDVVPLDVAELAALELNQLAVRSPDVKGASTRGFPLLLIHCVLGKHDVPLVPHLLTSLTHA